MRHIALFVVFAAALPSCALSVRTQPSDAGSESGLDGASRDTAVPPAEDVAADDSVLLDTPDTEVSVAPDAGHCPLAERVRAGGIEIHTHYGYSCAQRDGDRLWCWGNNSYGELGAADRYVERVYAPREMDAFHGSMVFVGAGILCGLSASGTLRCAGGIGGFVRNDPTSNQTAYPVPSIIPGIDRPASIFLGRIASCALSSERTLRCWGAILGELGDQRPVVMRDLPEYGRVSSISVASSHWCVLRCDGSVACAGSNGSGQLGTEPRSEVPWESQLQAVPASAGTRRVVTGSRGSCLLGNDGRVRCWGTNQRGELGDGTTVSRWVPREVLGLQDVTSLDMTKRRPEQMGDTICAVSRGAVYCWGNQLAYDFEPSRPPHTVPTRVAGLPDNVVEVAMGDVHALALTASGEVYCWGVAELCTLVQGDAGPYQRVPIRVPLPPP